MSGHEPSNTPRSARAGVGGGLAALVLAVLCCAAPALATAGLLGAVGTALANPIVLTVAGLVAAAAVVTALVRGRRHH